MLWNPLKTRLSWNLTWNGTVGQLRSGRPTFEVMELSGTISAKYRNAADPAPGSNCFGTLSRRPGGRMAVLWSEASGGSTVEAGARPPFGSGYVRSSAPKSTVCGNPARVLGVSSTTSDTMSARVELRPGSKTTRVSRTFTVSYKGTLRGIRGGRAVDSMKSTITLRLGAR